MPTVPKRSTERRRRNKTNETKVVVVGGVTVPPVDDSWHQIAQDWYNSLAESGQAQWYEPSDWAAARLVAATMTRFMHNEESTAAMASAIWTAMNDLLTTEASRRRSRMEIERALQEPENKPTAMDKYRKAQ